MDGQSLFHRKGKAVGHLHPFDLIQRHQLILLLPAVGILRADAADHLIQHRTAGVQVGPGALAAAGTVLLFRRVAPFEDDGQVLFAFQIKLPRRAEVDQRQFAGRVQDQVFRADVAVQHLPAVHGVHRQQNGAHQRKRLLLGVGRTGAAHVAHQRLAGQIVHHQVGGVIFLQKAAPAHDALDPAETCHQLTFPAEAAQRLPEDAALLTGQRPDLFAGALRQRLGEKLLDGHTLLLHKIHGQVGHAKTACAQRGAQQVTPGQDGEGRQRPRRRDRLLPAEPAVRAGLAGVRPGLHTPGAQAVGVDHKGSAPCFGMGKGRLKEAAGAFTPSGPAAARPKAPACGRAARHSGFGAGCG